MIKNDSYVEVLEAVKKKDNATTPKIKRSDLSRHLEKLRNERKSIDNKDRPKPPPKH